MTTYSFLKYFFIVLFSLLIYLKLSNKTKISIKEIGFGAAYTFTLALLYNILTLFHYEPYVTISIIIISGFIIAIILKVDLIETISFMIVSFVASHILFTISSFIISVIFVLIFDIYKVDIISTLISALLVTFFVWLIYKIKFKVILRKNICLIGSVLSGIVLIIYSVFREKGLTNRVTGLLIVGITLCGVGLFYWIKRESITTYNNKIQALNAAKLREETEQLREIHNYFEKLVHDDNKKLPAYQEVIENLILKSDNPEIKKKAEEILGEFIGERNVRFLEASHELENEKDLPSTGMGLVDGIFTHYYKICRSKGIEFDLITDGDMCGIRKFIPQSKLESIIANLLDNAIIACEYSPNMHKNIVAHFVLKKDFYEFAVRDNGIAFERETLELLGEQRVTTHADSGGSGIGFMTIFEIARSCKASVVITSTVDYKTVAVRFDGKDEYRVESQGEEIFS
jgi:signal transduction histidine kinase